MALFYSCNKILNGISRKSRKDEIAMYVFLIFSLYSIVRKNQIRTLSVIVWKCF